MPQANVNGIKLYYDLLGPENAPVLVLSNGIMMSTASWAFQVQPLSRHFRVLTYDCRGMWKSEHPPGPYSMEMHADDLAGLLDELDIERAHIAGISYGAEISMVFALNHPERTQSLIVIDGVSQIDPLLRAQTYPWLAAAQNNDPAMLFHTSYHMNFSEDWIRQNQAFLEGSVETYADIRMESFTELMEAFYRLEITDQLRQIKAPSLIIVGEEDLIKGRKYSDILHMYIPNSEYIIVPGSGHALCLEKPGELNSLLIGFATKNSLQE